METLSAQKRRPSSHTSRLTCAWFDAEIEPSSDVYPVSLLDHRTVQGPRYYTTCDFCIRMVLFSRAGRSLAVCRVVGGDERFKS